MFILQFLVYLLIFLTPIQLGKHFFFTFSLISGIRNDYLAPTIYLTDVIILFILVVWFRQLIFFPKSSRERKIFSPSIIILIILLSFLFLTSIFAASNEYAALYKFIKIIEFVSLGAAIVKAKPRLSVIARLLSLDVILVSVIGIWQFILERSIGGLLWFAGERFFFTSTPGIAAVALGGHLVLRPYSIFPHPNVFGGYLAVILPVILVAILSSRKLWMKAKTFFYATAFIAGALALILTFSRAAWIVAAFGISLTFIIHKKPQLFKSILNSRLVPLTAFSLMILSVLLPLILSFSLPSLTERAELIRTALKLTTLHPITGVGLNNFSVEAQSQLSDFGLFRYQPVHNVYLLILAENGLISFAVILIFILKIISQSLRSLPVITVGIFQLFLLGLFDHYLFTLQQGQLVLTLFAALAFMAQNSYTKSRA